MTWVSRDVFGRHKIVETGNNHNNRKHMNNFIDLENMQSMDELFSKSENSPLSEGKIIMGRVAMKKDNGILLDIGCKAEPFIPDTELGDKWETIKSRWSDYRW